MKDMSRDPERIAKASGEKSTVVYNYMAAYMVSFKASSGGHPPLASTYQSSSSSFLAMAFFRAKSASAKLPAKLGVGVLLLLLSVPFRLMPESRGCTAVGLRPAVGRLTGG